MRFVGVLATDISRDLSSHQGTFAWFVERPLSCQVRRFAALPAFALRLLLPPPSFLTFNRVSPPLPSTCCMPVHPREIEKSLLRKFRMFVEKSSKVNITKKSISEGNRIILSQLKITFGYIIFSRLYVRQRLQFVSIKFF